MELKIGFGNENSLSRFENFISMFGFFGFSIRSIKFGAPNFFKRWVEVWFLSYDFRSLKTCWKKTYFLGIWPWAETMGRLDAEEFCGAMPSEVRRYSRLERACGRFVDVLVEHINVFAVCLCKFC